MVIVYESCKYKCCNPYANDLLYISILAPCFMDEQLLQEYIFLKLPSVFYLNIKKLKQKDKYIFNPLPYIPYIHK